ncbi:hypothetical protein SAMN04487897_10477 [Paenibacillus sp. yr247]|nr:hypothetical protein [Paenibacillus sp. yr247]SDN68517.1 hypothetical protein SAMN04487897_10477 [Paenibacillus sp. yr247]
MVEYTNMQDNTEEIMKCIVNCDTEQDQNKEDEPLSNNIANQEEYIDEP